MYTPVNPSFLLSKWDYMGYKGSLTIRAIYAHFSEDQNTVVKLPVLLKYKLGNRLMSYEQIDVRIFILCFLIG